MRFPFQLKVLLHKNKKEIIYKKIDKNVPQNQTTLKILVSSSTEWVRQHLKEWSLHRFSLLFGIIVRVAMSRKKRSFIFFEEF